ncbi:MAG: hypothetical protein DCF30_07290 [Hyphomicrobiales bacterium]|nr:MAG: hypothetical protein DCF30_07290 [Hyphomicrobiales bacterium]
MTEVVQRLDRAAVPGAVVESGTSADSRNQTLHIFRAIAALLVVAYHASHYVKAWRGDGRFLDVFSGAFGSYGVAIFFALSGYLMAHLLERDPPGRFLVGRLLRIYPPMLLMVALFFLLFVLVGDPRGVDIITLLLAPVGPRAYFLGVEWTLLYEMTYYVALALLALFGLQRHAVAFVLLWLALVIVAWVSGEGRIDRLMPLLSELPLGITNLPFLLGFLTAHAYRRGWLPPLLPLGAALSAVAIALLPENARLLAGLSASLLVAAAVRGPQLQLSNWAGKLSSRLGDASYVLYLCHVPTFLLAQALLPDSMPTPLFWLVIVAAALGLSLLLGPVDVALHRLFKRLIAAAPPRRLNLIAIGFTPLFLGVAVHEDDAVRSRRAAEAEARQSIASAPVPAPASLAAAIDLVEAADDGRWLIRGYAIDLDRPARHIHIALRQSGQVIAFARMRRMRTATALNRKDISQRRFGFSVILPVDFDCRQGRLDAVLALDDIGAVRLPSEALDPICP